jgi:hypothetical protein
MSIIFFLLDYLSQIIITCFFIDVSKVYSALLVVDIRDESLLLMSVIVHSA